MRKKRPRVASADEVRITRDGEAAIIEFADSSIASTHLTVGPDIAEMTDQEILACYNDCVRAQTHAAATYEHVAIEIPVGRPQIEYEARSRQWVPRGDVLRCVIEDDENREPVIHIDDEELSWQEFGGCSSRMRLGMRIKFVPDDSTHEEPVTEVREPRRGSGEFGWRVLESDLREGRKTLEDRRMRLADV